MDPYLEGSIWTSVHASLVIEIARQLAPKLRPRYLALPAERFVAESSGEIAISAASMYPDVAVTREAKAAYSVEPPATIAPARLQLSTYLPEREPQFTVEIRVIGSRELVTAIEVLSPSNKRGSGREEYLDKRNRILRSSAHLLEIDLLRSGQRVPMREALPPAPYFVFLSRADKRPVTDVWPIMLDEPLPTVPVPLLPGDDDVALDLQLAFTTVYDTFGYGFAVDYTQPPEIPLSGAEAEWATERVRRWAG